MSYHWTPIQISLLGSAKLRRAHRRAELADVGWIFIVCSLAAKRADADGRVEDDGLPLEDYGLAVEAGKPTESVRACIEQLIRWNAEDGGWLRRDPDGCLVVVELEPLGPEEAKARKRELAAARQRRRRARRNSESVTPCVTPSVTHGHAERDAPVDNVTPSVTPGHAERDVDRDKCHAPVTLPVTPRARASETETETET